MKAWAIAAAAVLLVSWLGWSRRAEPATVPAAPPPPYAFDMCIARAPAAPAPRQVWNDAVVEAVARTLTTTDRGALEDALGTAATRWEASANPLLEDLEGGDPDASLIAWFKTAPSFVRTAQASAKLRACAPDGFCVTPRASSAACPMDSAPPESAEEADRARFLLWPWGHALRFRAASPDAARHAAELLRAHVPASHTLAIVMTAEDSAVTKTAPFGTIRKRWEKVTGLRSAAHGERTAPTGVAFKVSQGADEVLVLPRLDAIATGTPDEALIHEVNTVVPGLAREAR